MGHEGTILLVTLSEGSEREVFCRGRMGVPGAKVINGNNNVDISYETSPRICHNPREIDRVSLALPVMILVRASQVSS
jgi:hypothetical protein